VKPLPGGADSTTEMADLTVSQRLSDARMAQGEDLPVLARRIGVRVEHLRAIEAGRLADLPPGIYGRSAIRSFARACGFDPEEILGACESLLTPVEEPISAMGRLRGVRQPHGTPPPVGSTGQPTLPPARDPRLTACIFPSWRLLAAAAIDGCLVVTLLLVVVVCAVTAMMVPIWALERSGAAFALMGVLLGIAYFVWFGGLGGRTVGERVLRVAPRNTEHAALTLRAIGARAMLSATEDARFFHRLGAWMGDLQRQMALRRLSEQTAPPLEPLPWPPQSRGPGPARS
jgi:hypothetical protein